MCMANQEDFSPFGGGGQMALSMQHSPPTGCYTMSVASTSIFLKNPPAESEVNDREIYRLGLYDRNVYIVLLRSECSM